MAKNVGVLLNARCASYTNKLKQKKPPFLFVECSDFFCHDVEAVPGFEPRGCFWAHMCYKFKDSGATTGIWNSTFDVWNDNTGPRLCRLRLLKQSKMI